MHNEKAPRGAQTKRTKVYVICETRGAAEVRRDLARFLFPFDGRRGFSCNIIAHSAHAFDLVDDTG